MPEEPESDRGIFGAAWDVAGSALTVAGDAGQAIAGTGMMGTALLWGMFDDTAPAALLAYGWDHASTGAHNLIWADLLGYDRVQTTGAELIQGALGDGILGSSLSFLYDFGPSGAGALKGGKSLYEAWKAGKLAGKLGDLKKLSSEQLGKLKEALKKKLSPEEYQDVLNDIKQILKGSKVTRAIPRGFNSPEEFAQAGKELAAALKKSGLNPKQTGVRGSSVTGASGKGGPFRHGAEGGLPPSDIDVYIEFADDIGLSSSKNIPGFIHPDKLMKNFPALREWSQKWSAQLGREVSPGGFRPGTFSDPNSMSF